MNYKGGHRAARAAKKKKNFFMLAMFSRANKILGGTFVKGEGGWGFANICLIIWGRIYEENILNQHCQSH